jgi:hypothetical protein
MNEFDKPINTTPNEYLQLLGLADAPRIEDPKMFKDAVQERRGVEIHLVYDYNTLSDPNASSTENHDADEAFSLHTDLLLEPESKAVFLLEDWHGNIEAVALENPHSKGRKVRYRIGDTERFREKILPPQPWAPHFSINAHEYEADVAMKAGEDPHIIFYTAAHEMRDKIAADTAKLTAGLSSSAVLATMVFTPIVAMPKPDKGFYVHCSIGQMVFAKKDIYTEGKPLNKVGEIPIETPNAITMKMLMHMDKELEEMGLIDVDRNKPKHLPAEAVKEAFRRGARQGLHKPTK